MGNAEVLPQAGRFLFGSHNGVAKTHLFCVRKESSGKDVKEEARAGKHSFEGFESLV